ncbi:MAG: hypothetical protein GWM98_19130 [Nitrospinaceae bacterium]|nr:glycosyltransferase family 39 protein [Nitrospinaceae bacterium]NIR56206.1 glycosyltransferase family 39 protein [Nitrospinaceae bacterium]NIS86662.1 glycosyltransferase family 39 protein [Nitrospinaceae bacterium]NIT83495.1 glycosyltransferase family 39 protein [Nitrospinaceae bacterium]NIU45700.1 glycosyltransferase family 39 protein [Nitrospinaceae bacterium]
MSDISAEGQAPPPSDTKTQTRKLLWIVLALILLSRLVMWGMLKDPPGAFIEVDSHSYLDPAEALWQDGRYHIEPGSEVPETLRPPGYPLFLATVFALAGNSTHAIVFFQIALFLATCYLLYNFGERWFGPRPALWAVIFLAIDPPSLSYNFKIMSECLTAFLTLAFAWAVYRYFETRGRSRFGFLSGMFLTLATLVRPTTYYFLPVLLMVFLGFLIREKVDWKGTVRSLVITALPFIILIGGWQWRNLEKVGVFQFTTVKGWALYLGKGAQIYGDLHRVGLGEAEVALIQILKQKIPEWDSLPMERKDAIFLAEGKKLVKEHPWPAVKTHFEQMFYFFFGPGTTPRLFSGCSIPISKSRVFSGLRRESISGICGTSTPLSWPGWFWGRRISPVCMFSWRPGFFPAAVRRGRYPVRACTLPFYC